jgi:hypothetical protein
MTQLISDDILHEIAIVAPPDRIADRLLGRYAEMLTRTGFYAPYSLPAGFWERIAAKLRGA